MTFGMQAEQHWQEYSSAAKQGNWPEALKAISALVALHPKNVDFLELAADTYKQMEQPEKAVLFYHKAAWEHKKANNNPKALALYKTIISIDPQDDEAEELARKIEITMDMGTQEIGSPVGLREEAQEQKEDEYVVGEGMFNPFGDEDDFLDPIEQTAKKESSAEQAPPQEAPPAAPVIQQDIKKDVKKIEIEAPEPLALESTEAPQSPEESELGEGLELPLCDEPDHAPESAEEPEIGEGIDLPEPEESPKSDAPETDEQEIGDGLDISDGLELGEGFELLPDAPTKAKEPPAPAKPASGEFDADRIFDNPGRVKVKLKVTDSKKQEHEPAPATAAPPPPPPSSPTPPPAAPVAQEDEEMPMEAISLDDEPDHAPQHAAPKLPPMPALPPRPMPTATAAYDFKKPEKPKHSLRDLLDPSILTDAVDSVRKSHTGSTEPTVKQPPLPPPTGMQRPIAQPLPPRPAPIAPASAAPSQETPQSALPKVGTAQLQRPTSVFGILSSEDVKSLWSSAPHKRFRPGEVVFREGDPDEALYLIVKGAVEVTSVFMGKEVALFKLAQGDIFGEGAFLTGRRRSATITALEALDVIEINHEAIRPALMRYPMLFESLVGLYHARLQVLIEQLKKL